MIPPAISCLEKKGSTIAMLDMPVLETARLHIRPFVMDDLSDVHRLLDIELRDADLRTDKTETLAERARWLQWAVLNYEQLARLRQPPYGDRAAILKSTGQLIGSCGFVPCLNAFEQLPGFATGDTPEGRGRYSAEFGLFYAISPAHQRHGYASEAAQALVDYAFQHLHLKRVVATTNYDNIASMGVMRKLGMRIEKNPRPEPPWLQVVGVLENNS
jgi:RimJ/RimL family protein N-acetyltransferase